MDISPKELLLSPDDIIQYQDNDVSFGEAFRANVGYNNMPLFNYVEEQNRFGKLEKSPDFKVGDMIPDELLPYYEELYHAKNEEHYRFLEDNLRISLHRRDVMSKGGVTPALASTVFDPLFFASFIPVLNIPLRGASLLGTTARFGASGFAYGTASELRRAPFDVNLDKEVQSNIAASTLFSGAIGLGLKGVPSLYRATKSTVKKTFDFASGRPVKSFIDEDGNIQFDDGKYIPYDETAGEYDLMVRDMIPSPTKSALSDKSVPDSIKKLFYTGFYNSSLSVNRQRKGLGELSMTQLITTHEGTAFKLQKTMDDLYGKELDIRGKGAQSATNMSSDEWFEDTVRRYINRDHPDPAISGPAKTGATPAQQEAFNKLKDFFDGYDQEARYVGLLRDDAQIKKELQDIETKMSGLSERMAKIEANIRAKSGSTKSQRSALDSMDEERLTLDAKRIELEDILEQTTRKSYRFAIYYDRNKLLTKQGAEQFVRMATKSYERQRAQNPDRVFPLSAEEDARKTLARILQEGDEEMSANFSGNSKHLQFRKTGFEEWEIEPFMLKSKDVIFSYAKRMGGRIEFARKFENRSVKDILEEIEVEGRKSKLSEKKIAKLRASFLAEYERATGGLIKNADRWDNQFAQTIRNYSAWVYLPLAGISAIGDLGTVVLQHGMKDALRGGIQSVKNMGYTVDVYKNAQFNGELLDGVRNDVQRKYIGDQMKRIQPNFVEKFMSKGNKVFYTLNGLMPITLAGKTLDLVLVNDKFFKLSKQYATGNISKYDVEYLARYGITKEDAKYYADMQFEKASNANFYYANVENWPSNNAKEVEMIRKWQAATNAHANNSIIFGQQFDVPLIANGVVYAKDNLFFQGARKVFPNLYKIDPDVSTSSVKLVRLESQLMSLPFTFMNFAFAANNKILGRIRDPNQQYRLQASIALLGLSYLALGFKKPSWWFKDKDEINLGLRIIDHSGITGLYGDLGYMALHMAGGAGLYDLEKGVIKGKYAPDVIDSIMEPFGAPPGLLVDYGRAVYDFSQGNVSEGTNRLVNSAPFLGLSYIFGDTKSMLKDLGR